MAAMVSSAPKVRVVKWSLAMVTQLIEIYRPRHLKLPYKLLFDSSHKYGYSSHFFLTKHMAM